MNTIPIKIINKSSNPLPKYETKGAAGMDIMSNELSMISMGERRLIATGLYVAIPDGYEIQIRPRSGLAINKGITVLNSPGTIDSDYRGEIKVILANLGDVPFIIHKGDKIAQMIVAPVTRAEFMEVEDLSKTERGENGFGSTGF